MPENTSIIFFDEYKNISNLHGKDYDVKFYMRPVALSNDGWVYGDWIRYTITVIIRLLKRFNVFIRILMNGLMNVKKNIPYIVHSTVHARRCICTLGNVTGSILSR